ncbi:MAG: hypothetical protein Q9227_008480 [Pyrenula ochraceoflavens]
MAIDPATRVTSGALAAVFDPSLPKVAEPIVQCVQIKPLGPQQGAPDRYRVVCSDISNFIQCMLATGLNELVQNGILKKGCFCRLKKFNPNAVKDKKILIILDMEILEELGTCDKLGEPKSLEEVLRAGQPAAIPSNGFYGVKKEEPDRKPLPSRAAAPVSSAHANIYPIEALSPYSHKWTIKARCVSKSQIKTWHNRNGEGKLFSVNLLDESGEIRATGFNDQCDSWYDLFEEGSVYFISSPCRVQIAKKQFSNVNNDYELTFERETVVEKAEEADGVPQVRFNFTSIADLQTVEKDTTIDVIGILKEIQETSQITSKTTSKPYDKRELTLVDNTGYSVRLTVWGNTATSFDVQPDSVVAFKGVKVSDFGGRSLSLLSSGSMTTNPDIDESHKLKGWFDAQGRNENFSTHANLSAGLSSAGGARLDQIKTVSQVKDEQLGMNEEKPDFFNMRATVIYIKSDNLAYPSCLSEGCNKKVVEMDQGQWRCERCQKTHERPEWRYIASVNISDHTGQLWVSCFDEVGRQLLGMTADQIMELKENDEKAAQKAIEDANCKMWNFRCKARMDNYAEQQRVRYQVNSATRIDFSSESAKLAEMIKGYNIGD